MYQFSRSIYRELAPSRSRTSGTRPECANKQTGPGRMRGHDSAAGLRPPLLRPAGADAVQRGARRTSRSATSCASAWSIEPQHQARARVPRRGCPTDVRLDGQPRATARRTPARARRASASRCREATTARRTSTSRRPSRCASSSRRRAQLEAPLRGHGCERPRRLGRGPARAEPCPVALAAMLLGRRRRRDLHRRRRCFDGERPAHGQGADDAGRPVARRDGGGRGGRCERAGRRRRARSRRFAHGMTVGTNALLEERGARTALVATEGFADLLEIGRQDRPEPLPPLRAEAGAAGRRPSCASRPRERIGPDGRRRAARPTTSSSGWSSALRDARRRVGRGLPAVLLPATRATSGAIAERAARRAARRPRLRLARGAAALPRVRALLDHGDRRLPLPAARPLPRPARRGAAASAGLPEPVVMQSSGGVGRRPPRPARAGAWSVLSGPAGGRGRRRPAGRAVGRRRRARPRHGRHLLRRLRGRRRPRCGAPTRARSAAASIQLPMVDVHTVGAGGGSIGWRDAGGALRVGPRSAGAEPGPGLLRPRRHRADRHRRQPAARLPRPPTPTLAGGVALDARGAPSAPSAALGERARPRTSSRPPRGSSGSPTRRWSGRCGWSRSSAASTRAASRCCRSAAPGRCTPPRSPSELGIDADPLPARQRRALGARA